MALDLVIPSNEAAIHKLYKAIHQILLLRLSHTEIACLKTLILFRPGKFRVVLFIIIKTYTAWMGGACLHTKSRPYFDCFHIYSLSKSILDCVGLTSTYEIAMLQDESLKLLSESCGGATRMGHILLALPYIHSAADRKVIQV